MKGQEEQRDVEKQKRMVTELVASLKKEKAQIQDLQARLKISENDREEIKQTCERYQQDISTCKKKCANAFNVQKQQNATILQYQEQIREWGRKWQSREEQLSEAIQHRDQYYTLLKQANPE